MMSFRNEKLEKASWPNSIISLLTRIAEYKGKQALFERQIPEILKAMKETAVIQSTEASNRIEGIHVSTRRITALVQEKSEPKNRSEAEVAGYRDVLKLIHESAQYIPVNENVILQFHRDLLNYATGAGGSWKASENYIRETLPSGETRVRFQTVPAVMTPDAMKELTERYEHVKNQGTVNELLIMAAYILDFLCIHPFPDGSGRMARLLTLLLLYRSGYEVGRYISLEKVIEEDKEHYYDALHRSSLGWHEGKHVLLPWTEFFLTMLLKAYQRFEDRVGVVSEANRKRGWKEEKVQEVVLSMLADFSFSDIQERCPGISRPTIQKVLNRLARQDMIVCIEYGRNARWRKIIL
ncbi:cell filamentation protein Fic [Heliobacterium undosum]|uniref:Cell filamentation protein Fic n=2 Tax=Heliomicrobium undosum TaxID=121734 RepID=A0A845L303_9FIRM|nr:cell filamentation protein Fic [Heliomicrobium undosum]